MSGRRAPIVGGIAVVLALVAILVLSQPSPDPYQRSALDPKGTSPSGLRGVVELARSFDAQVRTGGLPVSSDDIVLQPRDTFGTGPTARLRKWVADGGTLVVADPEAALAPATRSGAPTVQRGACDVDALAGVAQLGVGIETRFPVREGASSCFAVGDRAGLSVRALGSGLVVALSSPLPLVNQHLAEGDDAVLATALLAPRPGVRLRVLDANQFFSDEEVGDGTIIGALPLRGRQAMFQLVVAFVVWGLVRGRRLGPPVPEVLPVPIPGSDLVLAVGEMLARGKDVAGTAALLRSRSRAELGRTLGLGPGVPPEVLVASLQPHVAMAPELVRRALLDPVPDTAALVDVAHHLDQLREDLHGIRT